jgi:hypothetical protein
MMPPFGPQQLQDGYLKLRTTLEKILALDNLEIGDRLFREQALKAAQDALADAYEE